MLLGTQSLLTTAFREKRVDWGAATTDFLAAVIRPVAALSGSTERLLLEEVKAVRDFKWTTSMQSIGNVWKNRATVELWPMSEQGTALQSLREMRTEALGAVRDGEFADKHIRVLKGLALYGQDAEAKDTIEALDPVTRAKYLIMTDGERQVVGFGTAGVLAAGGIAGGAAAIAERVKDGREIVPRPRVETTITALAGKRTLAELD